MAWPWVSAPAQPCSPETCLLPWLSCPPAPPTSGLLLCPSPSSCQAPEGPLPDARDPQAASGLSLSVVKQACATSNTKTRNSLNSTVPVSSSSSTRRTSSTVAGSWGFWGEGEAGSTPVPKRDVVRTLHPAPGLPRASLGPPAPRPRARCFPALCRPPAEEAPLVCSLGGWHSVWPPRTPG